MGISLDVAGVQPGFHFFPGICGGRSGIYLVDTALDFCFPEVVEFRIRFEGAEKRFGQLAALFLGQLDGGLSKLFKGGRHGEIVARKQY